MAQIPWGWGDAAGQGSGAYGDHQYGYGHAFQLLPLWCAQGYVHPDVGGDVLDFDAALSNALPAGPFTVEIGGRVAYGAVQGGGSDVYPDAARRRFRVALPHLFGTLGAVDVRLKSPTWDYTWVGLLEIVRHPGQTGVTLLATRHPTEVYATNLYVPRS